MKKKQIKIKAYDYCGFAYYAAFFIWLQLLSNKVVDYYEIKITTTEKTDFHNASVDVSNKKFYVAVGYKRWGFNNLEELTKIIIDQRLAAALLLNILPDEIINKLAIKQAC